MELIILIFFVFPLVTIILASVLEFVIKCPTAVAAVTFSIWLLIAFLVVDKTAFFIAVFIYTFLAFLAALIVKFIRCNTKCKSCECFNISGLVTDGLQDTIADAVNDAVNEAVPSIVNEAVNDAINDLINNNSFGCNNSNNLGCGCPRTRLRR